MEFVRRIQSFMQAWRDCERPICKRHRACRDPAVACAARIPRASPRQWARQRKKLLTDLGHAIEQKERAAAEQRAREGA